MAVCHALIFSPSLSTYLKSIGAVQPAQGIPEGDARQVLSSGWLQVFTDLMEPVVLPRSITLMLVTDDCEEPQVTGHISLQYRELAVCYWKYLKETASLVWSFNVWVQVRLSSID